LNPRAHGDISAGDGQHETGGFGGGAGAGACASSNCRRCSASASTARASSTARSRSISPRAAQTLATIGAITWNLVLNNLFTYRDQRLSGWSFVTGLFRFQVICAVGAISNVGIATWIYDYDSVWWIAGLGGALIGTVWNFAVSAAFVWRTP